MIQSATHTHTHTPISHPSYPSENMACLLLNIPKMKKRSLPRELDMPSICPHTKITSEDPRTDSASKRGTEHELTPYISK